MSSLLAKHWSSWSHLEELRRIECLVLDRVLRRQFLFCSVWGMALCVTWYESLYRQHWFTGSIVNWYSKDKIYDVGDCASSGNYCLLIETTNVWSISRAADCCIDNLFVEFCKQVDRKIHLRQLIQIQNCYCWGSTQRHVFLGVRDVRNS